jgi:hypothetical protein
MDTATDEETQRHWVAVERLVQAVCDGTEFPVFISDEASFFDLCASDEEEILQRLTAAGFVIDRNDLRLPVWKIAARLEAFGH